MDKKSEGTIICVKCNTKYKREAVAEGSTETHMVPLTEALSQSTPSVTSSQTTTPKNSQTEAPQAKAPQTPVAPKEDEKFEDVDEEEDKLRQRAKRMNDISKKMGEKLLLGWTMYTFALFPHQ